MKKWWSAIFLFLLGIAITNAYVLYCCVCARDGVTPMSHRDFRKSIAFHLITIDARATRTRGSKDDDDTSEFVRGERHRDKRRKKSRGARALTRSATLVDSKNRNSRVTASNLETVFLGREKGAGHGMTRTTKAKGTRCQLCNLHARTQAANMISQRSNNPKMPTANCAQVHCETCKVELCIECWNAWHKIGEA